MDLTRVSFPRWLASVFFIAHNKKVFDIFESIVAIGDPERSEGEAVFKKAIKTLAVHDFLT